MLTPQEIQQKKFEKAIFGGYDMSSVDDFLDVLTEDYTSFYKENVALKSKMKVLVEKIEEYRSVDDAMRKALITAQNMAKEIVESAKLKADEITVNARENAARKIASLREEVLSEEQKLKLAREKTTQYIDSIIGLHKKSLSELLLVSSAEKEAVKAPDTSELADTQEFYHDLKEGSDETEKTQIKVEEIDKAVFAASEKSLMQQKESTEERRFAEKMEVKIFAVQLPGKEEVFEDTGEITSFTPKPRFNFDNLKFGKDYSEKDD